MIIKSGRTEDQLIVDPTTRAARVNLYNKLGVPFHQGKDQFIFKNNSGTISASLGAGALLGMFFVRAYTTYITRINFSWSVITVGAAGGVPGVFAVQRANAKATDIANISYVMDAAKSLANTTGSGVEFKYQTANFGTVSTFGGVVAQTIIPNIVLGSSICNSNWDFTDSPIVVVANDALAIRNSVTTPGTMTWTLSVGFEWFEIK